MSEFSVNTDKISGIADLLEQQAGKLEDAESTICSIKNNLKIGGSARTQVMSAMNTTSQNVGEEASASARMGEALRQIAASYRAAESHILGSIQSGGGGRHDGGGNGGSNGDGGFTDGGQNGGKKDSSKFSADPVNLNTGNFILDNHDMEISGFRPLQLGRFYNSRGNFEGVLGQDWNMSFEVKLIRSADRYLHGADVCIVLEDGREEYFATTDGKNYIPVSGTTAELTGAEEGYVYRTLAGDCYRFDEKGKYVRFENAHGIGFELLYEDDMLQRVVKDSGEFFVFSYDGQGRLALAEDHTGRTCRYLFEDGKLQKVILPDGSAYEYIYNQAGKLSRVLNPRKVEAVETEYDDLFRTVYQRFADGTTNRFEYLDAEQAVIMIERNGSRSIHYHNDKYQNIRNVYLDGEESFEYNERGLKTMITDKLGNVTRLQYDNRGNITGILMPNQTKAAATYNQQNRLLTLSINGKNKVRNAYNAFGDLISTEDGLGRKTSYSYDERGQLTEAKLADGTVFCTAYDARGNLCQIKKPNGGIIALAYDARNLMTEQTDALGHKSTYTYDVMGRMISETRADGNSKTYEYDAWGNLVAVKAFDGSVTTTFYNENNKPVQITDEDGRTTYLEYDPMWNVTKALLPNGGIIRQLYDENNRLETVCDAEGNEIRYTYDAMGNLLTVTDAEGGQTRYMWDENGRCIKQIAADGAEMLYGYDEEDRIIYVKDAAGVELFRSFDAAGQLTAEKDSLGQERSYTYDEGGNLSSIIDEKGQKTCYSYSKGLHKVEEILYPDGTKEKYTYDLNGNVETHTDIYGLISYHQYDELDRLLSKRSAAGKIEYCYDLMGRVVEEKDLTGAVTKYEYSATGQLLALTDALGNVTRYSYDEMDELIEILKAIPDSGEHMRIQYERDRMGRITKVIDAIGAQESYQYNGIGKIIAKTDRDGMCTRYAYNPVGLLQKIMWADGREAIYEYDCLRRLSGVDDWTGKTKLRYDEVGNLLEITYPDDRSLAFAYDGHKNKTRVSYPDGSYASYEYDAWNRLQKVTQETTTIAYTYDSYGNIASRSLPGGKNIQYRYDGRGLLEKMTCTDEQGVLDEFTFGYDQAGRRTQYGLYRRDYVQDNGKYEYTYDPVGHLQQVKKDQEVVRSYTYDAFGNRSSMRSIHPKSGTMETTSYQYDIRGGLSKLMRGRFTEEYRYDRRGNLIERLVNGQTDRKYRYDALNRLSRAETADGAQAVYYYNGLGYRVGAEQVKNGTETKISYVLDYSRIYDNLIEKKEKKAVESYLWGNGLEGFKTEENVTGWYLTDPLGSVLRSTDQQNRSYAANYDEFGEILSKSKEMPATFGYNGFLFDPVAGTYFAQARQYRSYTGTFDAMDRFGGDITMPETINPYVYCVQDPFSYTDKSGYWLGIDDAIAAGIGAIGGLAGQLAEDVIGFAVSGEWKWSSWQEYVGSGIGGAAGGVATLYGGPIAGGAVSGGVSRLTTEGLTYVSDPSGYDKSIGDVLLETVKDTGMGALSGGISKLKGKLMQKLASSKTAQWIMARMKNGGKPFQWISDKISDIAHGKSSKQWSQLTKYLKNQHEAIARNPALKRKLTNLLFAGLPVYIWQEISGKFNPLKMLFKIWKGKSMNWLKDWLGLNDSDACAAAA